MTRSWWCAAAISTVICFDPMRTVVLPDPHRNRVDELRKHLNLYSEPAADRLVFVGPKGGPVRRLNWSTTWRDVVVPFGFGHLKFHDLRHTGNTLAAATGASTRELMARMGHSSARAALLYQHATVER